MKKEKEELKKIIKQYFQGSQTYKDLYAFAWKKIESCEKKESLFNGNPKDAGEYWYAIWQIQHLADLDHKKEGILDKELAYIIDMLEERKSLPKDRYGTPP